MNLTTTTIPAAIAMTRIQVNFTLPTVTPSGKVLKSATVADLIKDLQLNRGLILQRKRLDGQNITPAVEAALDYFIGAAARLLKTSSAGDKSELLARERDLLRAMSDAKLQNAQREQDEVEKKAQEAADAAEAAAIAAAETAALAALLLLLLLWLL